MKFLLSLLFIILLPFDAWAFVSHEYPAIYVHMLSLLFCFVALLVVLWAFIRRGLYKERRWKYLFLAAIFHAIWNADVIIGRIAEGIVDREVTDNRRFRGMAVFCAPNNYRRGGISFIT